MLSRTSFASLDFFMMTSLSRIAVCMRLTSVWFLMQETLGHVGFGLQIDLTQYVTLQNLDTYKCSHSLQQHVRKEIITVNNIQHMRSHKKLHLLVV